nr:copper-transporting ATPase PAA1, chloroplastic [Tanacetum cinerariifolium]
MESLGLSKALISSTNVQTLSSQLALIHVRRTIATAAVARGELRRSARAASFASGGEGGGGVGGFGGGGGRGGDGEVKGAPVGVGVDAFSSDVIILDVRGMTCGGCSASVKRILESQPLVSSASVNLTTETAIVWPVSEAKGKPNWQKVLGEELAKHLTNCGFSSNVRGRYLLRYNFEFPVL